MVDGGYIECLTEPYAFVDGYAIYKPGVVSSPEPIQTRNEFENPNPDEPSWIQYVPQESSTIGITNIHQHCACGFNHFL